ncbi:MAG: MOSC domain-containing protein, partial [Verrucomicrobiota bacterium]
VEGKGIVGDRYFEFKKDYKGQITFFATEVFERLCEAVGVDDHPPASVRRNVFTEGVDPNTLIGKEFEIQGIRFVGTQECAPCYWMDQAVGPDAEDFLRGQGGLRARILSSGELRVGPCECIVG